MPYMPRYERRQYRTLPNPSVERLTFLTFSARRPARVFSPWSIFMCSTFTVGWLCIQRHDFVCRPWGIQRFHGVSVSPVGVTCQNPHNRARLTNLKGSRRGTCVGTSRRFFRRSGAKGPEAQKLPEPKPWPAFRFDRRQRGKGSSVQRRAFVSVGLNNPCEVVDLVSQPRDLIQ